MIKFACNVPAAKFQESVRGKDMLEDYYRPVLC